jgi:oxalate decarboxylase/phosphoglucose isomerase-like protein (cupin superfamily)
LWQEAPAGIAAYLPKNSRHTCRNCGDKPARMIVHAVPAGFEVFFERIAEAFNQPGGLDMPRIIEISAETAATSCRRKGCENEALPFPF